jgi:iron complex outermembrane receptor protein
MIGRAYIATLLLTLSDLLYANSGYKDLTSKIEGELAIYEKVATKKKSNESYKPYIVSTFDQDIFAQLGVNTLGDILKIVPGVEISSDNLNNKTLIFRGSNPSSYGQSKLLIDGILVNNVFFDSYSEYLDMPIELIKRVEVIRGPGNKSSDIVAYVGSINVITHSGDLTNSTPLIFGKFGSNSYSSIGFRDSYRGESIYLSTDLFYKRHKDSVQVKSNGLKSGMFNFAHLGIDNTHLSTPDSVDLGVRIYSFGLSLKYRDIYFKSRLYEYKQGSAFGLNYIPSKEDGYIKLPNHYAQLGYKKLFKSWSIDTRGGIHYSSSQSDSKVVPDGLILPQHSDPTQSVTFVNGMHNTSIARQRSIYHSTTLSYLDTEDHKLTTSYYIDRTETIEVVSKITNRDSGVGIVDYSDTFAFFDRDAKRDSYRFSMEDRYNYSEALQFLSTLSYANNSHISSKVDPKFALVYQLKNSNIIKLLYTSSHRSPSWQELYTMNNRARVGNRDLKAEKIETLESSYIKHFTHDSFLQTSLFYIENRDQIHNITENNQYINSKRTNRLYGVELEYKGNLTPRDAIYFNLSYIDGKNSHDKTLVGVSDLLFRGYYIYNILENLSISTTIKHSSKKDRVLSDKRDSLDSSRVVDLAINYQNISHNYRVALSIQNIFDRDSFYPSKVDTYEDDYPQVGRSFILSYSKSF